LPFLHVHVPLTLPATDPGGGVPKTPFAPAFSAVGEQPVRFGGGFVSFEHVTDEVIAADAGIANGTASVNPAAAMSATPQTRMDRFMCLPLA
jgi:hypothetical protein